MKKVVLLLCVVFTFGLCFSQIKISTVKTTEIQEKKVSYDSLSNFVGKNYYLYVGQTLYVPKERSKEQIGYDHFNKKEMTGSYYKQRYGHYDTKYDAVSGKYFDVLDIVENKYGTIFLKIKEQKSGDIIFFEYKEKDKRYFPFIVVGYFEKQKSVLIGKVYTINKQFLVFDKVKDISGNLVKVDYSLAFKTPKQENYYDEWECIDYSIEEDFFWREIVVLENSKNTEEKIKVELDKLNGYVNMTLSVDSKMKDYDKAVEKYGTLRVGISEEACRALCGYPDNINTTKTAYGTSEQWVYKDKYIYIEDGKVTAIQEKK